MYVNDKYQNKNYNGFVENLIRYRSYFKWCCAAQHHA